MLVRHHMRNNIIGMLVILVLVVSCTDSKEVRREMVEDKMIMMNEDLNDWNQLTQ